MKKSVITLMLISAFIGINSVTAEEVIEPQPVVTIEIPANQVETIDVKYKNPPSATANKVKESTNKTVQKTKSVTNKTVNKTKEITNKTVDNTKDIIDELNPNKPMTLESIETRANIKTLKIERDAKKATYNSKIKDLNAQVKAAQYSTTLTEVQRQDKIHTLNKQKKELTTKRDTMIKEYNAKITEIRNKGKKES